MAEKNIEKKTCRHCSAVFEITDRDLEFYDKVSPVFAGKKYSLPSPTLCPRCRSQRRLSYRNDKSLYKSVCNASGKDIISMYNPKSDYIVYEQGFRWSDERDPTQYGVEFDPSISFFEQYNTLLQRVPRFNLYNVDTENCNYVNYAPHCKNCYLIFGSWFNESCFYGQTLNEVKNSIDNLFLDKSENCYQNIDCNGNYNTFFCQDTIQSSNSYFCYDCENVSNCIGCYNIKNKEYCIANKPVSKKEFENERKKFQEYQVLQEKILYYHEHIKHNAIFRYYRGLNNENVSGDLIFESKNAKHCFSVYRGEDLAYCARMFDGKDSYDFDGGGKSELTYENMSNDFAYFSIGCTTSEYLKYSHYCDLCFHCTDCFGCIGLRNKQYCILNKQYTKEEYETLVPQIIEKMKADKERGEFLDGRYSPFAYNETMAQEYFPLTRKEALERGYKRQDDNYDPVIPEGAHVVKSNQVEDLKSDEEILKSIFICEVSGRPFRIIKQELDFYRKHNLPLPRKHPDVRHEERMKLRPPRELHLRNCDKCGKEIISVYPKNTEFKVYCEECYNHEIYG